MKQFKRDYYQFIYLGLMYRLFLIHDIVIDNRK